MRFDERQLIASRNISKALFTLSVLDLTKRSNVKSSQ